MSTFLLEILEEVIKICFHVSAFGLVKQRVRTSRVDGFCNFSYTYNNVFCSSILNVDCFINTTGVVWNFYFDSTRKVSSCVHFNSQFFMFHPVLSNEFQRLYRKSDVLTGELRGIFSFKISKTLFKQVVLAVSHLTREWLIIQFDRNTKQ